MTLTLTPVDDVVLIEPPALQTLTLVPPLSVVPLEVPTGDPISLEPQAASLGLLVPVPGAPGIDGTDGANGTDGLGAIFTYTMPVAQTTAVIDHTLGRDPIAVQVLDEHGIPCEDFELVFTQPGTQIRVGFDIPVAATVRMT